MERRYDIAAHLRVEDDTVVIESFMTVRTIEHGTVRISFVKASTLLKWALEIST